MPDTPVSPRGDSPDAGRFAPRTSKFGRAAAENFAIRTQLRWTDRTPITGSVIIQLEPGQRTFIVLFRGGRRPGWPGVIRAREARF